MYKYSLLANWIGMNMIWKALLCFYLYETALVVKWHFKTKCYGKQQQHASPKFENSCPFKCTNKPVHTFDRRDAEKNQKIKEQSKANTWSVHHVTQGFYRSEVDLGNLRPTKNHTAKDPQGSAPWGSEHPLTLFGLKDKCIRFE